MALQLQNNTPFTCEQIPLTEKNGAAILRIVVKAAYTIDTFGQYRIADVQPDIVYADEYWGEPGQSSVQYESDVCLHRPYTDLIINGFAFAAQNTPVKKMDVVVRYQSKLFKQLAVFGDRYWEDTGLSWGKSSPIPFEKMPIVYDRAFGGSDEAGSEARNRIGAGYNSSYDSQAANRKLPNIEDPFNLISGRRDRPVPMGLGVISKNWEPRLSYAGTYDKEWEKNTFPLLPNDFDMRFNQSAAQDQWIKRPRGGEVVDIFGMTLRGAMRVKIPPCQLHICLFYTDNNEEKSMNLDSILIEPSVERMVLTWSTFADIHGNPFRLKEIIVGQKKETPKEKPCQNC